MAQPVLRLPRREMLKCGKPRRSHWTLEQRISAASGANFHAVTGERIMRLVHVQQLEKECYIIYSGSPAAKCLTNEGGGGAPQLRNSIPACRAWQKPVTIVVHVLASSVDTRGYNLATRHAPSAEMFPKLHRGPRSSVITCDARSLAGRHSIFFGSRSQ